MNEDQKPEETQPVRSEAADAAEQPDKQADQDRAFDEHPDVMAASTTGQDEGPSSRWAGWATGPRRGIAVGALAVLLLGAIGIGGYAVGNAVGDGDDRDRSSRGYDGRDRDGDDRNGDDSDDATRDLAAAELADLAAAYPDAVVEALSGSGAGTYWVRIETTDGDDLTLALDEDFDILETDGTDEGLDLTEDAAPADEATRS